MSGYHVHLQYAHLVGGIFHACVEEFHLVALPDASILYLEVGYDASEGVEYGVEDERLQRSLGIAFGGRYALHNGIQYLLYALSRLA